MARGAQGRLVDIHGSVHWVPDGNAARLDTVGQELAELAIQIRCGNPQQGREELRPDCHLQRGEVNGRVRRHALHILPFILQTEGEPSVGSLWVVAGHQGQSLHCGNPSGYHAPKPIHLARVAPDEATQVSLPSRVLDVQVIRLECLPSDRLVFLLADVPGLPWFREVAVPGPMAQQVTKTHRVVHGCAGSSSVIRISGS